MLRNEGLIGKRSQRGFYPVRVERKVLNENSSAFIRLSLRLSSFFYFCHIFSVSDHYWIRRKGTMSRQETEGGTTEEMGVQQKGVVAAVRQQVWQGASGGGSEGGEGSGGRGGSGDGRRREEEQEGTEGGVVAGESASGGEREGGIEGVNATVVRVGESATSSGGREGGESGGSEGMDARGGVGQSGEQGVSSGGSEGGAATAGRGRGGSGMGRGRGGRGRGGRGRGRGGRGRRGSSSMGALVQSTGSVSGSPASVFENRMAGLAKYVCDPVTNVSTVRLVEVWRMVEAVLHVWSCGEQQGSVLYAD